MNPVLSIDQETSLGLKAKRLRLALMLTQHDLAAMAGVPLEEVDLFEQGLPVQLDTRRKLLRELWARKVSTD
jgi:transcriptional regulator with XRE-family HTH domain